MSAHRTAAKARTERPNWVELWSRLRTALLVAGKKRDVAVLDNYKNRKETICRKFNVVCKADVLRISTELRNRK